MINDLAREALGFDSPEEAVGSILENGNNVIEVQGVVDNYYHDTMKELLTPIVFLVNPNSNYFSIRYNTGDAPVQVTSDLLDQVQDLCNIISRVYAAILFHGRLLPSAVPSRC